MLANLALFAASNLNGAIDDLLSFLNKILLLCAVILVVLAGIKFAEGDFRAAISALIGAGILALAVPISRQMFALGGGVLLF